MRSQERRRHGGNGRRPRAGVGFGQVVGQAMASALPGTPAAAPAAAAATVAAISADEVVATLEKLHGLVEKGILSQSEFDAKAELLKRN